MAEQSPPKEQKEYKTNWSKDRREHWNAYMREYNAKKKEKYEKQLNQISLEYRNSIRTYDKEEITETLYNDINLYTTILNSYIDRLPKDIVDKINTVSYSGNILEYIKTLQSYVKRLM